MYRFSILFYEPKWRGCLLCKNYGLKIVYIELVKMYINEFKATCIKSLRSENFAVFSYRHQ
jgi:hypothetical protein